jgi:uncharacterized membrane protein
MNTIPLTTFGAGAALMYFLDRDRGRRRRKDMLDKAVHFTKRAERSLGATQRDMSHRATGAVMMARSEIDYRLYAAGDPDAVLVERVRSHLGRIVTHPHTVEVAADRGRVTLSGAMAPDDTEALLKAVRRIRGVRHVQFQPTSRGMGQQLAALQGPGRVQAQRPDPLQMTWSPTTRTLAAAGGGSLAMYGMQRGGPIGVAAGMAGGALLTRSVTNMPLRRLFGFQGRRCVDVHKTITINAPIDQVFEFWQRFENFSLFMSHVQDVRDLGEGRSHWTVSGPAGATIGWDAEMTQTKPNEVIAWKSIGGSVVQHAGIVHFHETPNRSTQIDVQLTYNPPAGIVGHAIASIFGSDPKSAMDADLVRLKSLLEDGKASAHGRPVTLAEVGLAA